MATGGKVNGVADVIFLLDVTDSMDYCIDAVKKNIHVFVEEMQKEKIDWRARIIGFRNYDYNEKDWLDAETSPFTSDVKELEAQLNAKVARGGDPEHFPESALDALHYCAARMKVAGKLPAPPMEWRPTGTAAKCIILFTDAEFQETVSYTDGNFTAHEVADALNTLRIRLSIIAPQYDCYLDFSEEQGVLYENCGEHKHFRDKIEQGGYFEKIIRDFARTVTATATLEVS